MTSIYDSVQTVLKSQRPGIVAFPSTYVRSAVERIIPVFGSVFDDALSKNNTAFDNVLPSESVITVENGKLMAQNVLFAFCALILDYKSISKVLADALSLEFDLEDLSMQDRKEVRGKLRGDAKSGLHFMEYGVTTFSYVVWEKLLILFNASLTQIHNSNLDSILNKAYNDITKTQSDNISFLMCNYLYFVRAFCHNSMFRESILSICDSFKKEYAL